jgi:hypothetical protein
MESNMQARPVALITNGKHFIGPAAVERLLREAMTVFCHEGPLPTPRRAPPFNPTIRAPKCSPQRSRPGSPPS